MRVCVIVDNPMTYDRRVLRQVRSLRGVGHDVTVVALDDPDGAPLPDLAGADYRGVPTFMTRGAARRVARRSARGAASPSASGAAAAPAPLSRRLKRRIGRMLSAANRYVGAQRYLRRGAKLGRRALPLRPDVCHANNLGSLPAAVACKLLYRTMVVYDAHELEYDRTGFTSLAKLRARLTERLFIRRADHVITSSDSYATQLVTRYGVEAPTVVRNVAEPPREDVPVELPNRGADFTILYLGIVTIGRGLEQLVDALPHLPGVRAILQGQDMGMGARLAERARQAGVADRVEVRAPVPADQIGAVLLEADAGHCGTEPVSLSYYYSLPNKAFTYLSYGVPVIASDLPEHRALLEGTGAGVLFDVDKPESLVHAIGELVGGDRPRMRECALALYRENTWALEEKRLMRVYDDIEGRRRQRSRT